MAPDVALLDVALVIAADKAGQLQIGMSAEVVGDCFRDRRTIAAAIAFDERPVSAAGLPGNHGPGGLRNAEPKRVRGRRDAIFDCVDVVMSGWAFKKMRWCGAAFGRPRPFIEAQVWVKLKQYEAR